MEELFISNDSRLHTSPTPPPESGGAVDGSAPSAAKVTAAVFLGLLFVLGTLGNISVLVLLLRKLQLRDFTHVLMLNLVCCDLLCLTILPVWIGDTLGHWELSYGLCKALTFVTFCSHYANLYIITLMSVQRFMRVLHRRRWARMGAWGERALVAALWAVSGLMTWPAVASFGRLNGGRFDCSRPPQMVGQTLAAAVLDLLFGFVVPFSVMTSFYLCLYRRVKEVALSGCKRTSQLISRIIVTFVVLWVPIHVVGVVGLVGASLRTSRPDVTHKLERFMDSFEAKTVYLFPLFRLVIDPFLYAFSYRKIWPSNKVRGASLRESNV